MEPFYSAEQAIFDSIVSISVGMIFLVFGLRVLRLYLRYRSPLTSSFAGYNILAGVGFIFLGISTYIERSNALQYGALLSTPIFFVAVAYLSNFIWFVWKPVSRHRPVFWLFCILGLLNLLVVVLYTMGNRSLEFALYYLPLPIVLIVLLAGIVTVRYGTTREAHMRALFIGGSLIASSLIGAGMILFAETPLRALGLNIALVTVQTVGLIGITWISKNEQGMPPVTVQ